MRGVVVARLIVGAALGLVVLGCPPDYAQTCRFDGDDSKPCGMCIAKNCQASVNACCDDKYSCRDDMGKVDVCGRGGGCSGLASTTSLSGSLKSIATCIASHCTDVCGSTGVSATGTQITCRDTGVGCSCQAKETTGSSFTTTCSTAQVPSSTAGVALCCATSSWPEVGGLCSCSVYPDACTSGLVEVSSCN